MTIVKEIMKPEMKQVVLVALAIMIVLLLVLDTLVAKEQGTL